MTVIARRSVGANQRCNIKRWVEQHPEAQPLHLACFSGLDPHIVGFEYQLPPFGNDSSGKELRPGWYAVSINLVCGMKYNGWDERKRRISIPQDAYSYFRHFLPVDKVGYSIYIYRVTPEDSKWFHDQFNQR